MNGATPDPGHPESGYFGPGSATWRILADPIAGAGGLAALFMQALHPRAMAGVDQHSDFRNDFWPRLARTSQYVMTVAFGSRADADRLAARVRHAHEFVRGVDPVTGRPYRADEPDLLRWVHTVEMWGFLEAVRRAGSGLTVAEANRFLDEQQVAAALLGCDDVPTTLDEVEAYFDAVRPELTASPTSRRAALGLLLPPMAPRFAYATPARPAWAAVATLGFALQPRWARRMHGLPGLPTTDLAATVALRGLRSAVMTIPASWRQGPTARDALARERALAG